MINAKVNEAGNLVITADNESRAELAEIYREGRGHPGAESLIFEALQDVYEPTPADDTPDAWLCSAPFMIDCDGILYTDNGAKPVLWGTPIFTFRNYVFEDEWETLKNCGRVEWQRVEWGEKPAPLAPEFIARHFPGGDREGVALWVDPVHFPGADYDAVLTAWPEFARGEYEPDSWDAGIYFWRDGDRFGPYATSPRGIVDAERDGARFEPATPSPDPAQPELPLQIAA